MDRREFLQLTGGAVGTAGLAGCLGGGGGDGGVPDGNAVNLVTEGSTYYFNPIGMHVDPGTTVTFRNHSGTHSSTAYEERIPDGAEPWDSGLMSGDDTFDHTFDAEGTYDYYCTPHKSLGMVARIVVGSPGGPAEGSMPPDGDVPESSRIVDEEKVAYGDF